MTQHKYMLKRVPSSGHNYQDKVSRWFGKQTIYTFNIFQGKSASISLVFRLHNIAILGLVVRVIPALSTKSSAASLVIPCDMT